MKAIILTILSVALVVVASAQKITDENLPEAVKKSFTAKFSNAEKTSWMLDHENYKANFNVAKTFLYAKFNKEGKWLETQIILNRQAVPRKIHAVLIKDFGPVNDVDYVVEEAKKIEMPDKVAVYQLLVEKQHSHIFFQYVISEKGELIKKEQY